MNLPAPGTSHYLAMALAVQQHRCATRRSGDTAARRTLVAIMAPLCIFFQHSAACWKPFHFTTTPVSTRRRLMTAAGGIRRTQRPAAARTQRSVLRQRLATASTALAAFARRPPDHASAPLRQQVVGRRQRQQQQQQQQLIRKCCLSLAAAAAAVTATAANRTGGPPFAAGSFPGRNCAECAPPSSSFFPEEALQYDHYNGVIVHLERLNIGENKNGRSEEDEWDFGKALEMQLEEWKGQGKKGIWIHVPPTAAGMIDSAMKLGFEYHMVVDRKHLVLTKWLDETTPSRLPHGPTHQVGVGCLVFHPRDPSRMLVVKEKTGPAAAYDLWKMPTGLSDANEDVPDAAMRELKEETGLDASFEGILTFRQAHATTATAASGDKDNAKGGGGKTSGVLRVNSDLFFVCVMKLNVDDDSSNDEDLEEAIFQACPDEIAAIQWMSVDDYCQQERWRDSPVYTELNSAIREASKHPLILADILPLGKFGRGASTTNALYRSERRDRQQQQQNQQKQDE